jgi:hypothetical protein
VLVNVAGVFDGFGEGAHSSTITITVSSGSASEYVVLAPIVEPVAVYEPGIVVTPNPFNRIQEGSSTIYTVQLAAPPGLRTPSGFAETVTISQIGFNTRFISQTPSPLTFTRATWNTPQLVTLRANDDQFDRGAAYATSMYFQPSSNVVSPMDSYYGGAPTVIANVQRRVIIIDNDLSAETPLTDEQYEALNRAAWLDVTSYGAAVEGGSGAVLFVRVSGQPGMGDTVTVTLASAPGIVLTPAQITFDSLNWSQYQAVQVMAIDDGQTGDRLVPVQVIVSASSGETAQAFAGAAESVQIAVVESQPAPALPTETPPSGFTPLEEGTQPSEGAQSE